jgi:type IV pilus assembly protein PilC
MPIFIYSAKTVAGDIQTGNVDLPNREAVIGYLRRQRLIPVTVREKPKDITFTIGRRVRMKEIVHYTRQFATMVNSGLPLVQCLEILAQQTDNKFLATTIKEVQADVESGATLADALRNHPKVYSDLYVNMVAAGEAGGILDTVLLRLSVFLEKNEALVRKVKGAMIYPAVILAVAIIAVTVLLVFVIPTFESMFASVDLALPAPTRFVIFLSEMLQTYWWLILGLIAAGVWSIRMYYKTSAGRLALDKLLLRIPILGDLLRKSAVARFTRTLGTLLSSGVSILDGLEITARTAGNRVIHDAVMRSRSSIAGGETIAEPLKQSGVFPPMVTQMINVGEQTGTIDEMLDKIADFYDDEVDTAVEALLAAMEPMLIVFLGVVVGGMIVSMYLPIFDMINVVGQ